MTVELQRVVLPRTADRAVLPLYVDGEPQLEQVRGRRSYAVPANSRASFASYVNAFPAAYWQHWTAVDNVRLEVEVTAECSIEIFRSDARANVNRVMTDEIGSGHVHAWSLPLDGFEEGGWYWFDILTGEGEAMLASARWIWDRSHGNAGSSSLSLGVTTFNRVDSCTRLLGDIAEDRELLARIDQLYVVDQGTDRLRESSGFPKLSATLGGKLRVIEQDNIGGSGGFARAQWETLAAGTSDFVLLLDDDIELDPEALRRLLTFGELCHRPTVVGSQMLSLSQPTRLHATGERISMGRFQWGPIDRHHRDHDFAYISLRDGPWLHARVEVSYNGWWACLIPTTALRLVGLSFPLFIKWDDAEFGMRAAAADVPTVTLAGAGVWHAPWWDKDDIVDWQAYFHHRNRVITALVHSPCWRGGGLVPDLLAHQFKHLIAMQYSSAELRRLAVDDVMRGPDVLHREITTALDRVKLFRSSFPDTQVVEAPPADGGVAGTLRPSRIRLALIAVRGAIRQLRREPSSGRPEQVLSHENARWWKLSGLNSATVLAADEKSAQRYVRSRRTFLRLAARNIAVHGRLLSRWTHLAKVYREAVPDLTASSAWAETFESARKIHDAPSPIIEPSGD